jgi:hypothetical protein
MQGVGLSWLAESDAAPLFWTPQRLGRQSAWWGHVPFAFWLVANCKPRVIVELGTHNGVSYAAFCEAVARLNLQTRCFAVDTWQGDAHAGAYDEDVYSNLKAFNDERYGSFSKLLRKRFDEACDEFADGGVDLLHIDGFHTYEAVRHDFETWRSKLSPRAVVLFHDTNERREDFGVWRYFGELKGASPSFEFLHCHGLGVLAFGGQAPEFAKRLCGMTVEDIEATQTRVAHLGARWEVEARARESEARAERERADHVRRVRELELLVGAREVLERRQFYRIRPSAAASARGFIRLSAGRAGVAPTDHLIPVADELNLVIRSRDHGVGVAVPAAEGTLEPINGPMALLTTLRRKRGSTKRSVLRFDGFEAFPEGDRRRTASFRLQLNAARDTGIPLDSPFISRHPEAIMGWPRRESPARKQIDWAGPKIAVVVHLHYLDLWPEIETVLAGWTIPFKLFLTVTSDDPDLTGRVEKTFPGGSVRQVENRGRDVRPFLLLLEEGQFDSFDLLCKIHGKRSQGGGRLPIFGDLWRRAAFLDLIASDGQVRGIVSQFNDASVGLVGPRRFRAKSDSQLADPIGVNRETVETLANRMGAPLAGKPLDFFKGTMFWARPEALAPLRRLGLAGDSFPPETGQVDGALEHAVERLFGYAVELSGYRIKDASVDPD